MKSRFVVGIWIHVLLCALLFAVALPARAWVLTGDRAICPDGTVVLTLRLGDEPLFAGGPGPNAMGIVGSQRWNKYMKRVQVATSIGSVGPGKKGDGVNDVFFGTSYDGMVLADNVLASTFTRTLGSEHVESDIVVNKAISWTATDGVCPLGIFDLGRVVAHEVGHVLGLGHPDESGQRNPALMNAHYGDRIEPVHDDIEGIAFLYGAAPGFEPAVPFVRWTTEDLEIEERLGFKLSFSSWLNVGYVCQWYKDGVAIPGANVSSYEVASSSFGDAGTYQAVLYGAMGTVRSRGIVVKVKARVAPTVTLTLRETSPIYEGQYFYLSCYATGSSGMRYQWQKDGVDIPGATETYLYPSNVTEAQGGKYRVLVTNDVGTGISNTVTVVVNKITVPVFAPRTPSILEVDEGGGYVFTPVVSSPVEATWQWYKEGVLLGNTTNSITFYGQDADVGNYRCTASNSAGQTRFDFSVVIVPKKGLAPMYLSPRYRNYSVGDFLSLSPWTWSGPVGTYQWYKNGVAMPGRTAFNLYFGSLKAEDSGSYHLVYQGPFGTMTSYASTIVVGTGSAVTVATPYIQSAVFGGIVYYLQSKPALIGRYDLIRGLALDPLILPEYAYRFCVGSSGIFAYGESGVIWRCPAGRADFESFYTPSRSPDSLATAGDKLFWIGGSSEVNCLEISTKKALRSADFSGFTNYPKLRVSAVNDMLYACNSYAYSRTHVSQAYRIEASGLVAAAASITENLGMGLLLDATETLLVDKNGYSRSFSDLSVTGWLGSQVESVTRLQDGRVLALFAGRIHILNTVGVPVQTLAAPSGSAALFSLGDKAWALVVDSAATVSFVPLDLSRADNDFIETAVPSLSGVPLQADAAFVDRDGLLWLMSRTLQVLVAWSPETKRVVKSLHLRGGASLADYSPVNHCAYLAYSDRRVTCVDLSQEHVVEAPFIVAGGDISSLTTAGSLVIIQDGGVLATTRIYDAQGRKLSSSTQNNSSSQSAWDPVGGRVYGFKDGITPNNVHSFALSAEGLIADDKDAPVTKEMEAHYPLRVGGGTLLLGSGQLFDLASVRLLGRFSTPHIDALWVGASWLTITDTIDGGLLRRWNAAATSVEKTALVPGRVKRIFALPGGRLLVLGERYGALRFSVLDAELKMLSHDGLGMPNRLANLSVQADAGQGGDALVPGFVINGTSPKTLLLRGCGPGLAKFGVPGCLADPTITLYDKDGKAVTTNDDWGSVSNLRELRERSSDLYAFDLAKGSKDAVILVRLNPGLYSAQVQGNANGVGRALVEVYDAEEAPGDSRAVNMSARCKISKDHEAVGGFVVQGDKPKKMLIRAVGPALLQWSVKDACADPKLRVFSGNTVVAENNDWSADPLKMAALKAAFASTGAFGLDAGSKDAAVLVELPPGAYTMYMESADGGSGVGLLELYEVE